MSSTTVQEKNIAFPTDARLYERAMQKLAAAAEERGLQLRQSYKRIRKKLLRQASLAKRGKNAKKASFATTSKTGFVLSALSFRNEFDGDTLVATLEQAQDLSGQQIRKVYCDNGYRGRKRKVADIGIDLILSGDYNNLSSTEKKYCKHRSAVEPEIGHMKNENRLGRNFLKGHLGDALNIAFAGAGHNIRKILAVFRYFLCVILAIISKGHEKVAA